MMSWLIYVFIVMSLIGLLLIIRWLAARFYEYKCDMVTYLVIPQAFDDKALLANEAFFAATHSLGNHRNILERLFGRYNRFSFEIVSTKDKGIRLLISCPSHQQKALQRLIEAHHPHAKLRKVNDQINRVSKIIPIRQNNHFAFPIKGITSLEGHDPLGYVANAMANIEENVEITLQIIAKPERLRSADRIRRKILHNESFMPGDITAKKSGTWLLSFLNTLTFGIADIFSASYHQDTTNYSVTSAQRDLEYKKQIARGDRPVRSLSYFEHEVVESVNQKLKEPLFATNIRVVIYALSKSQVKRHKQALISALGVFTVPEYQSLRPWRTMITTKQLRILQVQRRVL